MRNKQLTLIEKLGFADPDRKTPVHDEMQIWVFNNIHEVLQSFSTGDKTFHISLKQLEYPVVHETKNYWSIAGYIDLIVAGYIYAPNGDFQKRFLACFEFKSSIQSCGDLIRQINFYRTYHSKDAVWIVVSSDNRFKDVLLEHQVFFFKYPKKPDTAIQLRLLN